MVLSVIAAGFSVFPVMVMYLLVSRRDRGGGGMEEGLPEPRVFKKGGFRTESSIGRRSWIRRVSIFVIWVLITVEVFLSPRGNMDYENRHDAETQAELNVCSKRGGVRYWQTMKAAQWLVIGAPLTWLVVTIFLSTGFGVPKLARSRAVRAVRSVWDLGVAWLSMLLAWALLAYFTVLRYKIIHSAEEANSGNEWGFGQILALATWAPVVLEFLYIFICESPAFLSYTGVSVFGKANADGDKGGIGDGYTSRAGLGHQLGKEIPGPPPSRSGTWMALASKPSESEFSPSRPETLVAHPYEGAGGEMRKDEWERPVEMAYMPERRRVDETTAGMNSSETLH